MTDVLTATDAQLVQAMRFLAERMEAGRRAHRLPGPAAVRAAQDALRGQRVGVVISGGNVDLARYGEWLAEPASH